MTILLEFLSKIVTKAANEALKNIEQPSKDKFPALDKFLASKLSSWTYVHCSASFIIRLVKESFIGRFLIFR